MRAEILIEEEPASALNRRQLPLPKVVTGNERRLMNPNRGLIKLCERYADMFISRYVYPLLGQVWHPYSWLLERRFSLAETTLAPLGWPRGMAPLRVLLITDIHAGIFLRPESLWRIVRALMASQPDLVVVGGDLVTGHSSEANQLLGILAPLSDAPLGAWFCFGNHDYFGGDPQEIRANLAAIGIRTLRNQSAVLAHRGTEFILGGIDDRIMGKPDWVDLVRDHGAPHLLMAHNPDDFYQAETRGVALTLSGHTHGGQIRFANGRAIIRQSRFCLDEGVYAYRASLLVVSRGLGTIVIPFRWGADPEAVLVTIVAPD